MLFPSRAIVFPIHTCPEQGKEQSQIDHDKTTFSAHSLHAMCHKGFTLSWHCVRMLSLAWPIRTAMLTPSNQNVPPEVLPLGHKRQGEQGLQVHPLHQQPEIICQDAELEESHGWLTGCLQGTHHRAWFCLDMSSWKHIFSFITQRLCMQRKYKTRKYMVRMHR